MKNDDGWGLGNKSKGRDGAMGKVVHLDREMGRVFELMEDLQKERIRNIAIVVTKESGYEEFFFCGHPGNIYQSLALAQGHLLQNFALMDDCETDGEEQGD